MKIEELKELQAKIQEIQAKINAKLPVAKADGMEPEGEEKEEEMCSKEDLYECYRYMYQLTDYIWQAIYRVQDAQWQHTVGHLPKLSATQLKKVLDKCGLSEDFNVQPLVTVYASKNGKIAEVDLTKK